MTTGPAGNIETMVGRVWALLSRYRVDRRLPPQVAALVWRTTRLRAIDRVHRTLASVRPTIGQSGPGAVSARRRAQRLWTVGQAERSLFDEMRLTSAHAVDLLERAGIRVTIVGRSPDSVSLAVAERDRIPAWDALVAGLDGPGWFVEWHIGNRRRLTSVRGRRSARYRGTSQTWRIFRAHAAGERAIGFDAAVELTLWEPGSSGQIERIGVRGQQRFDPRSPATVEAVGDDEYPGNAAFPVGANFEHVQEPVDIVYTWVDGSDPEWADAFRATAAAVGRSIDESALDLARYHSRDELRYSLRSVWMYCGWVRKIWIVTAGQTPEWLAEDERIQVVDHREILPAGALPTFNSHAIEAALHHIDGLAEQFVYFNDDMFIGRPVQPELFFTPNGLARVFPSDARVPGYEDEHTAAVDTAAIRGRELLRERFGRVATYKPLHAPYPLLRSVMAEMEVEFAEVIERTRHSRFRSPSDLSTAANFAQYYGLGLGRAVLGEVSNEYVHVESGRLKWHLDRIRLGGDKDTCCINETKSGTGRRDRERLIAEFFDQVLPVPAPWERDRR